MPNSNNKVLSNNAIGASSHSWGIFNAVQIHLMITGDSSYKIFGTKPLFLVYEARLADDPATYWNNVQYFRAFFRTLQLNGYAILFTAYSILGRDDYTTSSKSL